MKVTSSIDSYKVFIAKRDWVNGASKPKGFSKMRTEQKRNDYMYR